MLLIFLKMRSKKHACWPSDARSRSIGVAAIGSHLTGQMLVMTMSSASSFNLPPQDRTALFAKMDKSLKSGGTLIIQGYTAAQLKFNTGGPRKLDHMYDEAMMREAFVDYDIIDFQTYEAQIDEGTAHKGMSGLLGLTARKR